MIFQIPRQRSTYSRTTSHGHLIMNLLFVRQLRPVKYIRCFFWQMRDLRLKMLDNFSKLTELKEKCKTIVSSLIFQYMHCNMSVLDRCLTRCSQWMLSVSVLGEVTKAEDNTKVTSIPIFLSEEP